MQGNPAQYDNNTLYSDVNLTLRETHPSLVCYDLQGTILFHIPSISMRQY